MVLIDRPKQAKTSAVMKIDTGIAVKRDHGRPQRPEEEEQDHGDEDRGADQLALQRGDRGLDEAGLAEGDARRLHAGRQRGASGPSSASSIDLVSAIVSAVGCFWTPGSPPVCLRSPHRRA